MRVLHVLNELKPSGAETMLLSAAQSFKDAGLDCSILATGARLGVFAARLAEAGYNIHHIPFRKSPAFFREIHRLIAENFQVTHLHTERANFWIGLTALAGTHGIVLRTIHSNFEFSGNLRWRRALQRRLLARLGVQHVSIGESVQQNEQKRFGLATNLVQNWYDSRRFVSPTTAERQQARSELNIALDKNVIVSVGNCSSVKNHAAIIEALALLDPVHRPIYLHIGKEDDEQSEQRLALELNLHAWVRFLGPLEDIRPALYAADAFVMPSLYEGFGIAATESMATALPTILSDVPGLRDFRSVTTGAIYSSTEAASIAEIIAQVFAMTSEARQRLGNRAASDMARLYGIDVGVGKYIDIYRSRIT